MTPKPGFGPLIKPVDGKRPWWLGDTEIVVRDLPMGESMRRARDIKTWDHPFRLWETHAFYASPMADVWNDSELANDAESMRLINELRATEADSVTVLCDNPEGQPNNAVECNGDWTGYEDRRFEGATLLEALRAAATAKADQP